MSLAIPPEEMNCKPALLTVVTLATPPEETSKAAPEFSTVLLAKSAAIVKLPFWLTPEILANLRPLPMMYTPRMVAPEETYTSTALPLPSRLRTAPLLTVVALATPPEETS